MAVARAFRSWQTGGFRPADYPRCSPNLTALWQYMRDRWGGVWLGCKNVRSTSSGAAVSSHSFGAALDWRWDLTPNPEGIRFPGRHVVDAEILPWLIGNSMALGIQAIHDYTEGRIWRPPGTSVRPIDSDGWRTARGPEMNQGWAQWLHIETHPATWHDARPIPTRFRPAPPPPTEPTEEDDDMLVIDWKKGQAQWTAMRWDGQFLGWVWNGDADAVLRRAGAKRQTVNDAELVAIIESSRTTTPPPSTLTSAMAARWDARAL